MFTQRTARFGLAKVLGVVHIFLACVSLPVTDAGHHSVTVPADHYESSRRSPSLSFRIIEANNHGGSSVGARSFSRRRSHHRAVKNDENYVLRRTPVSSSHRRVHHRRSSFKKRHHRYGNRNINVNDVDDTPAVYRDEIPFPEINDSDNGIVAESNAVKLEAKLYTSYRFGVNIISVFGQILKAPSDKLTTDQFTSLNIILQALIHKQVYTFSLLPILKKLQNADIATQFKLVLQALAKQVPMYTVSACTFWLTEIEYHDVDIEELISSLEKPHNFLEGIDAEMIDVCKVKVAAEEMEPFDEPSKVTAKTLGLVFVKIFYKLKNYELTLSQKLFGAILINLPIGRMDPVLEEYISYIWDVVQDNLLPNWHEVTPAIEYGDPYQLVITVAKILLEKGNMPDHLKHAFKYILLHLKEIPNSFSDEYHVDMQILLNNEQDVKELFSIVQDDIVIPEFCELRDQMIAYINKMDINDILQGMNKYAYQKPIDLLIALLVRIEARTQGEDIGNTVAKLLSILISKKEFSSFTVTVSSDIDLVMLLDFLNVPDSDPAISTLAQKIQLYLASDLDLLINLQSLVPREDKSKCQRPVQCLLHILVTTIHPNTVHELGIPLGLIEMIRNLINLISVAINDPAKCKPYDAPEYPETPDDSTDVTVKPKPPAPESTSESPISSSTPLLISTDYDHTVSKPNDPDSHSDEELPIVHPTTPDKDIKYPDGWIIRPIPIIIPILKPRPPVISPKPGTKPIEIVTPIIVPETTRPTIKSTLAPPTSTSEMPPVATTPNVSTTEEPKDVAPPAENEPVLPPNLSYDQMICIIFPKDGGPPYVAPTKPIGTPDSDSYVEFPSIKELLNEFDPGTPFDPDELPDMPELLDPLKEKLGPNYIEELLGKRVNKTEYPTVISLMDDVLEHALENPKVKADLKLVLNIKLYVKSIEYITITALFPVVVDSQKIPTDIIHVTFDPNNPNANRIDTSPPEKIPAGCLTLAIFHPKFLVQQVDSLNPYGTLLPKPNEDEDNPIQELINEGSLQDILGPEFDPLSYPNKGTLLTIVIQRLIVARRVESDFPLLTKLIAYLESIKAVALHNKMPKDYGVHILEVQQNDKINWQPDIPSLIMALPPPRNRIEAKKLQLIKTFLQTPNLLELLGIDRPLYFTTRGALLKTIFHAAIRGNRVSLDLKTLVALKYYQNKIMMNGYGALPIVWVWVQMFIIREEVPLGEIIEAVIDYDSLPYELRISYNNLMTYLSENPKFLQGDDSFAFEKYPTKGSFLAGLFEHFLTKPEMSPTAKKYINQLLPHIKLVGPGAEVMKHVTIDDIANGSINQNGMAVWLNG